MKNPLNKTLIASAFFALAAQASPSENPPSPFRPVLPGEVKPGKPYDVSQPPVENAHLFTGRRVLLLAAPGVQDIELSFPYEYLVARGATVEIAGPEWAEQQELLLVDYLKPTTVLRLDLNWSQAQSRRYDLIVVPGGAWATAVMRTDATVLQILRDQAGRGAPIAAICSGAAVLIESGLARGRNVTGSPTVRTDLVNAGGRYVDQAKVVDRNVTTSRSPEDLPAFVEGLKDALLK